MISKDIIEEKILALQEEKKDLADEMILGSEEKSLMNLSSEELLELLG
jgi:SNF2 family DNA or RNA helicase